MQQEANFVANLRPRLTDLGIKTILFVGLKQLLFSPKLLNSEHDFPETYLFDVWRLCSLQRKLRIDAAALCIVAQLRQMLTDFRLAETENGRLALERVVRIFLVMDYGTRVGFFFFWGAEHCFFF